MLRRRTMLALIAAAVAGSCWLSTALSQQDPPPQGRQGRQGRRQRMTLEQMRQRMAERMRERLGASEEEWTVLGPKIEKVQQVQRASRGGFGFRFRGRRPRGGEQPAREQSEVQKKTAALQSLLDDENSSPRAIKAALDALRAARAKAAQQLEAARKELRAVVTVRQEAVLVLMNILD